MPDYREASVWEVGFVIGDERGLPDGAPFTVKPPGAFVTALEFEAWILDGTVPADVQLLPPWIQRKYTRVLRRFRYLTRPGRTAAEAAAKRGVEVDEAQRAIDQAHDLVARAGAHGFDLNWGHETLKTIGVALVHLNQWEVEAVLAEPFDERAHPYAARPPLGPANVRVRYEDHAPPALLAKLRDPAISVPVRRNVTFTKAEAFEVLYP